MGWYLARCSQDERVRWAGFGDGSRAGRKIALRAKSTRGKSGGGPRGIELSQEVLPCIGGSVLVRSVPMSSNEADATAADRNGGVPYFPIKTGPSSSLLKGPM